MPINIYRISVSADLTGTQLLKIQHFVSTRKAKSEIGVPCEGHVTVNKDQVHVFIFIVHVK